MFIEIENVFHTERTILNLDHVTEIDKERFFLRTVDGKKYHIVPRNIERLLKMIEPIKLY